MDPGILADGFRVEGLCMGVGLGIGGLFTCLELLVGVGELLELFLVFCHVVEGKWAFIDGRGEFWCL